MNETDFLAAVHRLALDRVAHAHVRQVLQSHSRLRGDVIAGWPAFRLCGTLPPYSPDAACCSRLYQAALAEALRDASRHGAVISTLRGGAGLVIPSMEVAA